MSLASFWADAEWNSALPAFELLGNAEWNSALPAFELLASLAERVSFVELEFREGSSAPADGENYSPSAGFKNDDGS